VGNDGIATEVQYHDGRIDLLFPYCEGFVGIEAEDTCLVSRFGRNRLSEIRRGTSCALEDYMHLIL
jgi:hypothetical protein